MYNREQIAKKINSNAHRQRGEYEKSGFKEGVSFFYPCDDHVIRLRNLNGKGFHAILTRMDSREDWLKTLSAPTRAEAVLLTLMHMRDAPQA